MELNRLFVICLNAHKHKGLQDVKNLLDKSEIEIPCENCRRKTKKTIGWIKTHNKFACACGTEITLDAKQFKTEIAKVERSLADPEATIKKFGK